MTQGLSVEATSAGLIGIEGAPVPADLIAIARDGFGIDLSRHRSQLITRVNLSHADAIVGMEHAHVSSVVVDEGAPLERSFTLGELVRIVTEVEAESESDPVERAQKTVWSAHRVRQSDLRFVPGEDVRDPFGGTREDYLAMATKVESLCRALVRGLFGNVAP
jgi:protein-tyrosine-phosphatase